MEIRFCDRCSESIPDADFDAGRAATVGGRHYHVSCALTRSLSLGGPRSWLTLLLALSAAGMATFLLVRGAGNPTVPDRVTPAVEARLEQAMGALAQGVAKDRDRLLAEARNETERQRSEDAVVLRDELKAHLETLSSRIAEMDRLSLDRLTALGERIDRTDKEVGDLSTLLRDAIAKAEEEAARRVAPMAPPTEAPPPVVPAPPAPEPPREPAKDPEHEANLAKWIGKLKDTNENVRFSATLELGRLKDLRATPPLVDVLSKDRDYYVRLGAATALSDLKAASAVPALIEALDDDDTLVRTAANDALQSITGQAFEYQAEMASRERKRVMKQWRDWWKDNEAAVRQRLGQ